MLINRFTMWRILFVLGTLVQGQLFAQPLGVYMLVLHGAGCDDQSGVLVAQGYGGGGNYSYLWDNGSVNDTVAGLGAGLHSVTVYSGSDSAVVSWDMPAFGIDTVIVHNVCGGDLGGPGWVHLDDITAQYPLAFAWYDGTGVLLSDADDLLESDVPGTFHYAVTDAEGCVDSGTVVLAGSNPVLEVFVSDSVLCYGQSALMWYTPGFTLYDNWGQTYDSNTDTIFYVNQMGGVNAFPSIGVDAFGCEAAVGNNPFVYQQSHPDAVPLYHHEDTISTTFVIDLQPSTIYTYIWSFNGQIIDTTAYSYLPIDTSGWYGVSIINEYGCSVFGSIQGNVSTTGVPALEVTLLRVGPNPATDGEPWNVVLPATAGAVTFRVLDATGRLVLSGNMRGGRNVIGAELPAGTYILEAAGATTRLVRTR